MADGLDGKGKDGSRPWGIRRLLPSLLAGIVLLAVTGFVGWGYDRYRTARLWEEGEEALRRQDP
ncbi:MAG: hypothetical protein ACKOS8_02435, partial [Gemmataceae bacterium]